MDINEKARFIISALAARYPGAGCTLDGEKPYELLFATRLAAQCTDARVNVVTRDLYKKYPTLESFALANEDEVEKIIHSCGLGPSKARDICACARVLVEKYEGRVPDNMKELLKLPGVGRKTANLILGDVYGKPAVVTDTHCIRISNRLGLVNSKIPKKVEDRLREIIPPEESNVFCHRLVLFGREICTARAPECGGCSLAGVCTYCEAAG